MSKHFIKQAFLFILFSNLIGFASLSANELNGVQFESLNLEQARQKAGAQDQLFFMYFSADWCLPCQWMQENTFSDSRLSAYVSSNYIAVKVDLDAQGSNYIKAKFNVNKIPSILVFSAAGVLVERRESTLNAEEMLAWLEKLNIPAHHLRQQASRVQMPANNAMDAPQPILGFSKPALIPDEEPTYNNTISPSSSPSYSMVAPNPSPRTTTVRPQSVAFTPRSGQQYGVALGPETYSYSEGIQAARELEQKFDKPANILPTTNGRFRIIIGKFDTTSEARKFLVFLNRNNLIGEVSPFN